jgi:FPC/CPF motif-containing protein YcgG
MVLSRVHPKSKSPGPLLVCPRDLGDDRHELHQQFPWAAEVYREYSRIMEGPFPCLFARRAHQNEQILYLLAGSPDAPEQRRRVRQGMLEYLAVTDRLTGMAASMNALTILFEPERPMLSVEEYHRQAWSVMQDWIDHDPMPWPASIPTDAEDPLWSLCFRGVPVFVNVSCPAHVLRRSRNVGPSLALVTQPRAGFDLVAGPGTRGDAIREAIRRLMNAYDDIPAPDDLGTYTRTDNREWLQYVLREDNHPRTDRCPLRIRRTGTAGSDN